MNRPNSSPFLAPWRLNLLLALFVPYLALNTVFPSPWLVYAFGLGIAAAGAALACRSGVAASGCLLQFAWPSRLTLAVLAMGFAASVPIVTAMDRLQPHANGDVIGRAIASGVAQEVYFRGALLFALRSRWDTRRAILVQAALFAAWHVRGFLVVDPATALALSAISGAAGVVAAVLALRDRTIVWVAAAHAIFLTLQ